MKSECDIILLSYESPELLEECVRSVLEHTRVRSRLIIVDNGSRDARVAKYIHSAHGNETVILEKIFSEENAGFAAGMNKGMRLSDAPFVCLLNNDCVVTDGWLEEMIKVARSRSDIGLVNPQSNTFGSRPDEGATLNDHAGLIRTNSGRFVELGHAIGFALLVKREVIDTVGYLDEGYEGVCYEDTDYSIRAQKAGYISVMTEGAYVYHREQASRKTLKGKEEIYRKNRERLEKKWGRLLRMLYAGTYRRSGISMAETYEMAKGLARQRCMVEMWVRREKALNDIFFGAERRKSVRHADIGVKGVSGGFLAVKVLWRVLTKKKRYDAVVIEEGPALFLLRMMRAFHKAEVLALGPGTELRSDTGKFLDLRDPEALCGYLRDGELRVKSEG